MGDTWLPISEAPTGRVLISFEGEVYIASRTNGRWFIDHEDWNWAVEPDGWMPLPSAKSYAVVDVSSAPLLIAGAA